MRISKIIVTIILIVSMVLTNIPFNYSVYSSESHFTYTVSGGEATITGYTGPGGDVVIPGSLGGYPVISIGRFAFSNKTNITSIDIPNSVKSIEYAAFYLTSPINVTIGNSVTSIGDYAFNGCSRLSSITIPNSVISIGHGVFSSCSSLTSVTIGNGVTSIGSGAFSHCSSLTSINIPDSVKSIGDYAFSDCSSLTRVTIGNGVTSIGSGAFSDCSSLTSITIPDSVKSIGDYAFSYCVNLASIVIPDSVESIGNHTFTHCLSLTSISIPNSIVIIGNGLFHTCIGLKSITIPGSVTSIGDWAFACCSSLQNVYFKGNAPTNFGNNVFSSTHPNFKIYYIEGRSGFTSPTWKGYPTNVLKIENGIVITPTAFSDNKIIINARGYGYAYFNLNEVRNGTYIPLKNRDVRYKFLGSNEIYSTRSTIYGEITIKTPLLTGGSQSLMLEIESISGVNSSLIQGENKLRQQISVEIIPLSFSQTWEGKVGAGAGLNIGAGAEAQAGPAKAEMQKARLGVTADQKQSLEIKNTYNNGVRTLEITQTADFDISIKGKLGVFASVDIFETGVKLNPVKFEGKAGYGQYGSVGLEIENYNPSNLNHISEIGKFLFQTTASSALYAGSAGIPGQNVAVSKLLELLKIQSHSSTSIGQKVFLESSGKVFGLEIDGISSTEINLVGLGTTSVFSYDIKNSISNEKMITSGVKHDNNLNLLNFETIAGSSNNSSIGLAANVFAKDFMGQDTKFILNYNANNQLQNFEIEALERRNNSHFIVPSWTESNYNNFKFSGNSLTNIRQGNQPLNHFMSGNKAFFSANEMFDVTKYVLTSNLNGEYTQKTKKEKLYEIELPFKIAGVLGKEMSFYLSGSEEYEYESKRGVINNGRVIVHSESHNIQSLVDSQKLTLSQILLEPANAVTLAVENYIVTSINRIGEGVSNGLANIRTGASNLWGKIVKVVTGSNRQSSFMIMAMPGILGENGDLQLAITLGESYIIVIEDEQGNVIDEFDPIRLELSYDEETLTLAGVHSEHPMLDNLQVYYWDENFGNYVAIGGEIDKENMLVAVDITKNGEYILAMDNLAPDISHFAVSNSTPKPVITAVISDMSGLDFSTFSFMINGEELVNESNVMEHFNSFNGNFRFEVAEPLPEGYNYASIIVSDTSGNILPQAAICEFYVNYSSPQIDNVIVPSMVPAGESFVVRADIIGESITAYAHITSGEGEEERIIAIEMTNTDGDVWEAQILNTLTESSVRVSIIAYNEYGNMSKTHEELVVFVSDASLAEQRKEYLEELLLRLQSNTQDNSGTIQFILDAIDSLELLLNGEVVPQEKYDSKVQQMDGLIFTTERGFALELISILNGKNPKGYTKTTWDIVENLAFQVKEYLETNQTDYFLLKSNFEQLIAAYSNLQSIVASLNDRFELDHDTKLLRGVSIRTQLAGFENDFVTNGNSYNILDSSGDPASGRFIGTGHKLQLYCDINGILDEVDIVVLGDLTGSGTVTISDYLMMKKHLLGQVALEDEYHAAADLDSSGEITIVDLAKIKSHLLLISKIGFEME